MDDATATGGWTRRNWYVIIPPYIKNAQVFSCPSRVSNGIVTIDNQRVPLGYAMVCDYAWGWRGYSYRGSQSCLFETHVEEPANQIFIAELPSCSGSTNGYMPDGRLCRAAGHRVCPPRNLDPAHRQGAGSWDWHTEIDVNNGHERHTGGSNYIFFDGHVKWMRVEATIRPKNIWTLRTDD